MCVEFFLVKTTLCASCDEQQISSSINVYCAASVDENDNENMLARFHTFGRTYKWKIYALARLFVYFLSLR